MARYTHRSRQGFAGLILYIQIQRDLNSNYGREKRAVAKQHKHDGQEPKRSPNVRQNKGGLISGLQAPGRARIDPFQLPEDFLQRFFGISKDSCCQAKGLEIMTLPICCPS
jgi:hypothetical protein